jgi:hypothetical protein
MRWGSIHRWPCGWTSVECRRSWTVVEVRPCVREGKGREGEREKKKKTEKKRKRKRKRQRERVTERNREKQRESDRVAVKRLFRELTRYMNELK